MPDLTDSQAGILALAAILALLATITGAAAVVSAERQRRTQAESMRAIDFVRSSFVSRLVHDEPIEELLGELAGALRDSLQLDEAQIWIEDGGLLKLVATTAGRDREPIPLDPRERSITASSGVTGSAWAGVWLPGLIQNTGSGAQRVAPLTSHGELFGLIVIERKRHRERLARDSDAVLGELAREVGAGLQKRRLDANLRETLAEVRRQATELEASRARIVAAADAERRRMERDLHDGAQQHLVAIAVKTRLVQQLAATNPAQARALSEELTADVEAALEDLRILAHGLYPPLLTSDGLSQALAAAARRAAVPVRLETRDVGRYPPEVEAAVYYCCLESLQNVAKHAGRDAAAEVSVWEEAGALGFRVRDRGPGFDVCRAETGAGLTNMRDRMGAVGGHLEVESEPGAGACVAGSVPLGAPLGGR